MKNIVYLILFLVLPFASSFAISSCLLDKGMCIEFKNGYTIELAQNKCTTYNGSFSLTGCSLENKVKSCETSMPCGSIFLTIFYASDWTLAAVTDRCNALKGRLF